MGCPFEVKNNESFYLGSFLKFINAGAKNTVEKLRKENKMPGHYGSKGKGKGKGKKKNGKKKMGMKDRMAYLRSLKGKKKKKK